MKRTIIALSALLLAACTDTSGISETTTRSIHPKSNPNAAVTVTEFADLQCPACRAAHTLIVQPLLASHGTKMRYEFKHFPIASLHRHAIMSAQAAECAADQGKFWEFVDMDYEHQEDLSAESVTKWATDLGLDMELFERCQKSGVKKDIVLGEYDEGREMGVQGTPSFFVNGKKVETDLKKIQQAVDDALAGLGAML